LSFARPQARHFVISRQAARDERHPPAPAARIDPRVADIPDRASGWQSARAML
jgi:hypothetical protein